MILQIVKSYMDGDDADVGRWDVELTEEEFNQNSSI